MELVKSNDSEDISQIKIYGCPECGSSIEIESIKDGNITYSCFKCNNKNKFIPIKDFLRKMENFNSTFNNCNYCNKKENNQVNWKYCLSHKITLCDICINKHKNENGNECNLIENNKKLFSCQFHSNEENKSFCKVCKTHLCAKCLKDEKIKELHRGHHKDHFDDELTIYEKDKKAFIELMNEQENLIETLQIKKNEEIEKQYQNDKKNLENEKERVIKKNDDDKGKDLKKVELKAEDLLNDLENRYKAEKIRIKNNLLKDKETIEKNFKYKKEEIKTQYNEQFKNLKKEYEKNKEEVKNSPEIKNIKNSLQITQLIQKMNTLYPDNYYYNRHTHNRKDYNYNKYKRNSRYRNDYY